MCFSPPLDIIPCYVGLFKITIPSFYLTNELFRPGAFFGLESLEWLTLGGNRLESVAATGLFPKHLKVTVFRESVNIFFIIRVKSQPLSE